jgi:RNA polymerase sigma factor (sigma-70 family)
MANGQLDPVLRHLRRIAGAGDDAGVADSQLLERFLAQRDEAAFELLVWRHERMVHGVCRRLLRDPHDAEDAFQATFLVLVRKARSIAKRTSLASWLYKVAYRVALRARAASARAAMQPLAEELTPVEERDDPAAQSACRDLGRLLDRELHRLPEKYRLPLVLCYLEGKTYSEAARQLGWSVGTVSTRLTRGRDLLRRRLVQRGLGVSAALLAAFLAEQAASASVPAALVQSAVKAALLDAAGKAVGGVPASVLALTEGALQAMNMTRLKVLAAMVLAVTVLTAGGGWLTYQTFAAPPQVSGLDGAPPKAPPENPKAPGGAEQGKAVDQQQAGWQERATLTGFKEGVISVAFSPDGKTLATGCLDGTIRLWDVATGKGRADMLTRDPEVLAVVFAPDGKWLAVGGGKRGKSGVVSLWDLPTGKELMRFEGHADVVVALAVSPDGRFVASGSRDGTVKLWHTPGTGIQPQASWEAVSGAVFSVAFSPDGKLLATAGGAELVKEGDQPNQVTLWDTHTRAAVRSLSGHHSTVTAVAFSPDGQRLATASFDQTFRVWDLASGQMVFVGKGHNGVVRSLAWSPDGRVVATGSFDETVKLWDTAAGKELATLKGPGRGILSVAFSPDGRTLAAGSGAVPATGVGEPAARLWELKAVPGAPPGAGDFPQADSRLGKLLNELLQSKRGDEQVNEALTLATLGRLPTAEEQKFAMDHVSKKKDRHEAFADVLWALVNTREFRENVDGLSRQLPRLPPK